MYGREGSVRIKKNNNIITKSLAVADSEEYLKVDSVYFLFLRLLYACQALHNQKRFRFPVNDEGILFDFIPDGNSVYFRILSRDEKGVINDNKCPFFQETPRGSLFSLDEFTQEVIDVVEEFLEFNPCYHDIDKDFIEDLLEILAVVKINHCNNADGRANSQHSLLHSGKKIQLDLIINLEKIWSEKHSDDFDGKLQIIVNGTNLTKALPGCANDGHIGKKSLEWTFLILLQKIGTLFYGYPLRLQLAPALGVGFVPSQQNTTIELFTYESSRITGNLLTGHPLGTEPDFSVKTNEVISEILRICEQFYFSMGLMTTKSSSLSAIRTYTVELKRLCADFIQNPSRYQRRTTTHHGLILDYNGWNAAFRVSLDGLILTKRVDDDFHDGFIHDFPDSYYGQLVECIHDLINGIPCKILEYDCSDFFVEFIPDGDIVWFRYALRDEAGTDYIDYARKVYPNYEHGTPLDRADLIQEMILVCEEFIRHVDYSTKHKNLGGMMCHHPGFEYTSEMRQKLSEEKFRYEEIVLKQIYPW